MHYVVVRRWINKVYSGRVGGGGRIKRKWARARERESYYVNLKIKFCAAKTNMVIKSEHGKKVGKIIFAEIIIIAAHYKLLRHFIINSGKILTFVLLFDCYQAF